MVADIEISVLKLHIKEELLQLSDNGELLKPSNNEGL